MIAKLNLPNNQEDILDYFVALGQRSRVVIESTASWYWLYDFLTVHGLDIVAEIEDISRFPSYRHLASYAGLVPCVDASADRQRIGKITKQGSPYLRTALVEAAHAVARVKNCKFNIFFRRRIVRSGYAKAIVARARKILQIAYYVLKNQTPYMEEYPGCA